MGKQDEIPSVFLLRSTLHYIGYMYSIGSVLNGTFTGAYLVA